MENALPASPYCAASVDPFAADGVPVKINDLIGEVVQGARQTEEDSAAASNTASMVVMNAMTKFPQTAQDEGIEPAFLHPCGCVMC